MPTANVTYTFAANTLAKANEANTNFSDILLWLNTHAIQKDASVAFTGVPSGPATNPTSANHLVRKDYVDIPRYVAVGALDPLPGSASPAVLNLDWTVNTSKDIERKVASGVTDGFRVLKSGWFLCGLSANFGTTAAETLPAIGLKKNGARFTSDIRKGGAYSGVWGEACRTLSPIQLAANDLVTAEYSLQSLGQAVVATIFAFGIPGTIT